VNGEAFREKASVLSDFARLSTFLFLCCPTGQVGMLVWLKTWCPEKSLVADPKKPLIASVRTWRQRRRLHFPLTLITKTRRTWSRSWMPWVH